MVDKIKLPKPAVFTDAKIMFRNFEGKEALYNNKGNRNFLLFLEPEIAAQMAKDGWNVKNMRLRDEDAAAGLTEGQAFLKVKVYPEGPFPPTCVLVTGKGKTTLPPEQYNILDWVQIENVDLIITPGRYEMNGKQGVSTYLKQLFLTMVESELDIKYQDMEDLGSAKQAVMVNAEPNEAYMGDEPYQGDEPYTGGPTFR